MAVTKGRCAGCGFEDASERKVRIHTIGCPEFIALWKANPEQALEPAEAHAQYHQVEAKEARKEAHQDQFDTVRGQLQELAARRQEADRERWRNVREHAVVMVAAPPDGRLVFTGTSTNRTALAKRLCSTPE